MSKFRTVLALVTALGFANAAHALECESGEGVLGAAIMLPQDHMGSIIEVDHYARMDSTSLVHICDRDFQGERLMVFDVYAEEFAEGQGICMSYTRVDGRVRYSCASPAQIAAALAAPRGAPANTLRFVSWSTRLPSF